MVDYSVLVCVSNKILHKEDGSFYLIYYFKHGCLKIRVFHIFATSIKVAKLLVFLGCFTQERLGQYTSVHRLLILISYDIVAIVVVIISSPYNKVQGPINVFIT